MKEASYYRIENNRAVCELCPRLCNLKPGQIGLCMGRSFDGQIMVADNYGQAVSLALDPIEKKPLYHYHPGSYIVSLGPNSCNLHCAFCQNWEISQQSCPTRELEIPELIRLCKQQMPYQVAFTYSEPTMWYEYIMDFAAAAPEISIVLVSNGHLNPKPWQELLPLISALNIDLKSMRPDFYKDICHGKLEIVKKNIIAAFQAGVHLEITFLLIPRLNDFIEEINELALFLSGIDSKIPLHISAYRPAYKLQNPPATLADIEKACELAARYLQFVYAGNVLSHRFGKR